MPCYGYKRECQAFAKILHMLKEAPRSATVTVHDRSYGCTSTTILNTSHSRRT